MTTSRPARTGRARVRVLLCLASALLLACLPVIHHHPAQANAAPSGPSDQSCTLCVVLAGMDVDSAVPPIEAPPLTSSAYVHHTGLLVFPTAEPCMDGRAPPAPVV